MTSSSVTIPLMGPPDLSVAIVRTMAMRLEAIRQTPRVLAHVGDLAFLVLDTDCVTLAAPRGMRRSITEGARRRLLVTGVALWRHWDDLHHLGAEAEWRTRHRRPDREQQHEHHARHDAHAPVFICAASSIARWPTWVAHAEAIISSAACPYRFVETAATSFRKPANFDTPRLNAMFTSTACRTASRSGNHAGYNVVSPLIARSRSPSSSMSDSAAVMPI